MTSQLNSQTKEYGDNDIINYGEALKKKPIKQSYFNNGVNFIYSSIKCVGTNFGFTICISDNGNVYSVGYSDKAHGHAELNVRVPKKIYNLENIKMIDCSSIHSICLNYNGDVFTFGSNVNGELGIRQSYRESPFTHIPQKINIPPCIQVGCGEMFSFCLTQDNTLYSFGENYRGCLGIKKNNINQFNIYSSQLISDINNGKYIMRGKNYNEYVGIGEHHINQHSIFTPQLISNITNVEYITCGGHHTICKTYDNKFYSCGRGNYGQLGGENFFMNYGFIECVNWPDNIISVKCGIQHSLLLTLEGYVYSFGSNLQGQLGLNDKDTSSKNIPTLILNMPEIKRIECGNFHSMCIDINDNLWIFGRNEEGCLGLGDTDNKYKPIMHPTLSNIIDISSGGNHTFVKTQSNKVYAFGSNYYSQLGMKTKCNNQLTPIQTFIDSEYIWYSITNKSKQKSARK